VTQELSHRLGREASNQELAEALNVSTDMIDQARVYDRRVTVMWLDQESGDGEDDEARSLLNTLADPTTSNAHTNERDERLVLTEAMRHLPDSQRELLQMRYFDDLTQAELSRRLGISQMEVCRRLKKAEKQLRTIVSSQPVR
jgi:RNA polymerase sigma-B factor